MNPGPVLPQLQASGCYIFLSNTTVCRCVSEHIHTDICFMHFCLMLQGARRCWMHLSCSYTGYLNDSMAIVIYLSQDVASFTHRLPQLSCELEIFSMRKQGANHSHENFRVQSCSWPSSSVIDKSHHVLSCQPWLHKLECTCPTSTRWQSCLCCTRQTEENDEPAADELDCHKSHFAQSCCYPFNDGAIGIQFFLFFFL